MNHACSLYANEGSEMAASLGIAKDLSGVVFADYVQTEPLQAV